MFDIGLIVTVEAKSTVFESSSTDNKVKLEILDNAKIYGEKVSLGERIHKVYTRIQEYKNTRIYFP